MVDDRYGTWTRSGVGSSAAATVGMLNIVCGRVVNTVNAVVLVFFRPTGG